MTSIPPSSKVKSEVVSGPSPVLRLVHQSCGVSDWLRYAPVVSGKTRMPSKVTDLMCEKESV